MKAASPNWWRWLLLALVVIVLDQYTKILILGAVDHEAHIRTVTGFFNLVRQHNPGAAFSFLAHQPGLARWFFTGLALVAGIVITWMLRRHGSQSLFACALALILGGALGNGIDRIWHGYVVDFLSFHWGGWAFPAFNLADSAITLGAALLILDELRRVRAAKG